MRKHITDYESDVEYMADQPTYKLVLFGVVMLVAAGVVWVVNLFTKY